MSRSFICKTLKESTFAEIFQTNQVSDQQLQDMLTCREQKELDFTLIDIREDFEFRDLSIKGCDLLLPTSTIHQHMEALEERFKDKPIILYCRTGVRTGHMIKVLKRMGFTYVAHLTLGITQYSGITLKNATVSTFI